MRLRIAVLALAFGLAVPAGAQTQAEPQASLTGPALPASQAAADLRAAIEALKAAKTGKDRIAALTATIRAYETGLGALREALRGAAIRENAVEARLNSRRDGLSRVLGVMTGMQTDSAPLMLLHPDGPLGTVRSGMILSAVTPALQAQADALKKDLAEIKTIRSLQEETAATLQQGMAAVQDARVALAQAIQDRTDLPTRFQNDPEELRALSDNADTLDAFAQGLSKMETDVGPPRGDFGTAKGVLPLPVLGRVVRRAGEADAAGIVRPGLLVATRPAALVTTPWPATIRYRGPLLDYGNVMILEPASGYLLVLAGLGTVYGDTGDVVAEGMPVGLMGGTDGDAAKAGGADRTETLYIELREKGAAIDPGPWFAETKEP